MTLYKVLVNGKSCHGGNYKWPLPLGKRPGKWTPLIANPVMCQSGYHLTAEPYRWYKWGADVWEAEGRGCVSEHQDPHKVCFAQSRLLRRASKPDWLVGAEEFVASLKVYPWFQPDGQPDPSWRLYQGETLAAARTAALDAARTAARTAAWAAALDAAGNAALDAALDAAWAAARDAAWDAAWDAARDAAWDAGLQARVIVANLVGPHADHARKRMEVWKKGYALLCDVNSVLYVYAKKQ